MDDTHPPYYQDSNGVRRWFSNNQPCDESDETDMWRCTVCGRIGEVGRCCGLETREPVKMRASDQLVSWWNGKETVWFVHELNGAPPPIEATIPLFTGETK